MMGAAARALTCASCGAPLDLGRMRDGRLDCTACGASTSVQERGLGRLRTFQLPSPPPGTVEGWLTETAHKFGVTPIAIEVREAVHPFFARAGLAEALLYGRAVETRQTLGGGRASEEVDRFLVRNYSGHLALRVDQTAPAVWLNVPHIGPLIALREELATGVELWSHNFDEYLRAQLASEIEQTALSQGWNVVAVNVTVDTSGELFVLHVPFFWVRFRVARPSTGRTLVPAPSDGWYDVCYAFDGRLVSGVVPRVRAHAAVWLLAGVAVFGIIAMLAACAVLVAASS